MSNIQVTIPESQAHVTEAPAFKPFYQEVRITPINNITQIDIQENNVSNIISFDIPGDNVVNFYDSYLTYDMTLPTCEMSKENYKNLYEKNMHNFSMFYKGYTLDAIDDEVEHMDVYYKPKGVKCALRNSFGIDSIKVYNTNGVTLFYVDQTYNDYIDFMRLLTRSETTEINNDKKYFDGCEMVWDKYMHKFVVEDLCSPYPSDAENDNYENRVVWYHNEETVKVKLYFKELFNSILSLRSDIKFFEKIRIDIKFGNVRKFAYGFIDLEGAYKDPLDLQANGDPIIKTCSSKIIDTNCRVRGITLTNFAMMVACNQDNACNENTINYICSHEIDINDFHCATAYIGATKTDHMNYQFNINSSYGPYLKFILYRNLNDVGLSYKWRDGSNFRWYINDLPYSIDYIKVNPEYQSFQKLIKRIKNSYYNNNRREEFTDDFFEILDFSNESLINMGSRTGRALDEELKLTFEANNNTWLDLELNTNIAHRFYIVTGRLLKIGTRGIEAVI